MGAAVELLGPAIGNLRVFTDDKGFFTARGLFPGTYSVKVSAPAFLPTLREKISVRAGASVLLNLTLNTLFDAVQFAPRRGGEDDADWDWVLRSSGWLPGSGQQSTPIRLERYAVFPRGIALTGLWLGVRQEHGISG
jgi:hypothetical protein